MKKWCLLKSPHSATSLILLLSSVQHSMCVRSTLHCVHVWDIWGERQPLTRLNNYTHSHSDVTHSSMTQSPDRGHLSWCRQHFAKCNSGGRLMFYKCMYNRTVQWEGFGARSIKDIKLIGEANALLKLHCHNNSHSLHLAVRKQLTFCMNKAIL